jgi:hypothetical protein
MLKGVDQILNFATDWLAEALFSAILTNCHLQSDFVNQMDSWSF